MVFTINNVHQGAAATPPLLPLRKEFVISLAGRSMATAQRYNESLTVLGASCLDVNDEGMPEDLHGYLLQRGYKPATIVTHVAAVRSYLRYLHRQRALPETYSLERAFYRVSAVLVQVKHRAPSIPTVNHFKQVFTTLKQRLAVARKPHEKRMAARDVALFLVLWDTGLRRAEVCSLTRSDLKESSIIRGKGDRERAVFFSPRSLVACQRYLRYRVDSCDALFASEPPGRNRGISPVGVNWIIERWSDGLHPHQFRHAYARRMLARGVRLEVIQDLLGHASPNTTKQAYAVFDQQHLAEKAKTAWEGE